MPPQGGGMEINMTNSIKPPETYAEWAAVIDMFKAKTDDETVLASMRKGTLEWQSGVAERFSKKLIDAVNYRMNSASDKFQKEMGRAGGQESAIVRALLALRKEMSFLARAIDLPVLPEKDRLHYRALVTDQADNMQRSLEDSAKKDRTGKLASIVRNNKVNVL
ncbi:MAG: hypothetical protein LUG52_10730 [Clostridia bacterium]|nr:hypothetical protein [Clostridia bacterium]